MPKNSTKLHKAIKKGELEEATKLINKDALDINAQDKNGNTPLYLAVEKVCNPNEKFSEYMEFIKLLLQKGAKTFVKYKNSEYKSKIIELATNCVNCSTGNSIAFLLLKLAIENFQDEEDICNSIKSINSDVKNKIFKGKDNNLLHIACCKGNLQIISFIINKFGIDSTNQESINTKNEDDNTPLHLAILSNCDQAVIELLLQRNPDIDAQNDQGNTPLHLAARSKNEEAVKLLLNKKAKVNIKNIFNDMPLHIATRNAAVESTKTKSGLGIVRLLLQHGANIHDKDADGKTFLDLVKNSKVYIPLLELVIKYKLEDIKNFLSKEPDLVKKLNKEKDQLSGSLKELIQGIQNISSTSIEACETSVNSNNQSNEDTSATNHADVLELTESGSKQNSQTNVDSSLNVTESKETEVSNEAISATAETSSTEDVDSQNSTDVSTPEEGEKITRSNSDPASLNTQPTNQDVQNNKGSQINQQKKQISICNDRLINKKEFKQQNKICRNLTIISMVLCIAAVLALCYIENMGKLPKIGLGLIAGILFVVGTVSMVPSDKLDSTKIKAVAYKTPTNN